MATGYVINIGDASAKQLISFVYEDTLNAMSNCQVALDGVTSGYSSEFDVDKEIFVYKNGTLKFRGIVVAKDDLTAGGIVLTSSGIEIQLTDDKCPMVGNNLVRTFTSTTDNSIIDTLVTSVTGWTVDVSNSSAITPASFRVSASESVWNGVIRLIEQVGKDIRIDQENKIVYLYDELTNSDKFSFIEGKNATGIKRSKLRSKAGKVIVYGKGDGDFQIIGTSGASTPVHVIIDRNIISTSEANARALVEYNKLNPQPKRYNFTPTSSVDNLSIGDMGNIANNSAGIDEEVDIVRIKTRVDGNGVEKVNLEVTNPAFRLASKNAAEASSQRQAGYNQSQSAMQGSGNLSQWGAGINANNSVSLKVNFEVSAAYFQDEAGNLRVSTMTLDYDVDKYNSQYGGATFSGSDPQVQNSSSNTEPDVENSSGSTAPDVENSSGATAPDVENSSGATAPGVTGTSSSSGESTWTTDNSGNSVTVGSGTLTDSAWTTIINAGNLYIHSDLVFLFVTFKNDNAVNNRSIRLRAVIDGKYFPHSAGLFTNVDAGEYVTMPILCPVDIYGDNVYVQAQTQSGDMSYESTWNFQVLSKHTHGDGTYATVNHSHGDGTYAAANHSHGDGTYAAENHLHDDGTYNAANHLHNDGTYDVNAADLDHISIGDGVGEAGSVNASQVSIYLDFWNTGTSNWDNKHSILNTGKTLDTGVDITDSGTYPDAVGYWRVRVITDNATPDFVQSIVNITHELEN